MTPERLEEIEELYHRKVSTEFFAHGPDIVDELVAEVKRLQTIRGEGKAELTAERGPKPATDTPWRISDAHGLCLVTDDGQTMVADGSPNPADERWWGKRGDFEVIRDRVNTHEALCDRLEAAEAEVELLRRDADMACIDPRDDCGCPTPGACSAVDAIGALTFQRDELKQQVEKLQDERDHAFGDRRRHKGLLRMQEEYSGRLECQVRGLVDEVAELKQQRNKAEREMLRQQDGAEFGTLLITFVQHCYEIRERKQ